VNIELSVALEQIMDSKIARGEYKDHEDLIKQAILLLTEQDQLKLEKLNEALFRGHKQLKKGEVFELELKEINAEIDSRIERSSP
jgi:Arc/MetJ-type ribon-helix-helix transcriptional regulator